MTGMLLEHNRKKKQRKIVANKVRECADAMQALDTNEVPNKPIDAPTDLAHELQEEQQPDESAEIAEALENVEKRKPGRPKKKDE